MEAEVSYKMLIPAYQIAWRQVPEDSNIDLNHLLEFIRSTMYRSQGLSSISDREITELEVNFSNLSTKTS
jgi:hypothetical protein